MKVLITRRVSPCHNLRTNDQVRDTYCGDTRNRSDGAHQTLYDGTNRSDSLSGEKCAINTCAVICIICVYLAINCV